MKNNKENVIILSPEEIPEEIRNRKPENYNALIGNKYEKEKKQDNINNDEYNSNHIENNDTVDSAEYKTNSDKKGQKQDYTPNSMDSRGIIPEAEKKNNRKFSFGKNDDWLAVLAIIIAFFIGIGYGAYKDNLYKDFVIENGILTGYKGQSEIINIPKTVKDIDKGVFSGNKKIKEVRIPKSVKSIGAGAFRNCSNIERIKLHNGLIEIGNYAFGCDSENYNFKLKEIIIPSSVSYVGEEAFRCCPNVSKLLIEDGSVLCNIQAKAFMNTENHPNKSLGELIIPGRVASLGDYAFQCYPNISRLTLNNGIGLLGNSVFINTKSSPNNKLTELNIPGSIKKMGTGNFCNYISLKKLIIQNGITEIPDETFTVSRGTENKVLEKIEIPKTVKVIGANSFQNFTNLKEIIINSGVREIRAEAFLNDKKNTNKVLEKLEIPGSVKIIGANSFQNYYGLKKLILHEGVKNIKSGAFVNKINNKAMTDLYIPGSVEYVGKQAFCGYDNLNNITVKNGKYKNIDKYVFEHCKNIKEIKIPKNTNIKSKNDLQINKNCNVIIY